MRTYYIGMGSNLGDREAYLNNAIKGLEAHPLVESVEASSWLETPPWGNEDQGPFLNGVCKVQTTLPPQEMLSYMQELERQAGRVRTIHWGPRTLDLDIVWAEEDGKSLVVNESDLQVPHPYMWERSFVLAPLQEVYPHFVKDGVSIGERLKEL